MGLKKILIIILLTSLLLTACSHPNQDAVKKDTEPPIKREAVCSEPKTTEPPAESVAVQSDTQQTLPYVYYRKIETEPPFDYEAFYSSIAELDDASEPNPVRIMIVDPLFPWLVMDGKEYIPTSVRFNITLLDIERVGYVNVLYCDPLELKDNQANFGLDGAAYGWYTPGPDDEPLNGIGESIYDSFVTPGEPVLVIYFPSQYAEGNWIVLKESTRKSLYERIMRMN